MEYPFGHKKHQHHGRDEEQQSYPPPHHQSHSTYYPGREGFGEEAYPPPPPRPLNPYENPVPGYAGGEQVAGEFRYPHHQSQEPHFGRPDRVEPGYQRPPPPSDYGIGYNQRPPPSSDYGLGYDQRPPPPSDFGFQSSYPEPRPAYSSVQHVAHAVEPNPSEFRPEEGHRGHHNPFTSFFHHHSQGASESSQKRTVRVFCEAEENYSLTIRDGKVILARSDPRDEFQHWIKDEKYSTKVKDEEGFPSFALVNKATGQALKHSIGATHPVQLSPYIPDVLDESILWTESRDTGAGFRTIRMVNNIRLNLDAFNGDKNHGGVRDGTILVLWEWKKGGNQKWKIVPY